MKYTLPTGSKYKKVVKVLSTLGLSVVMMFSATFGIASCTPRTNVEGGNSGIVNPTPSTPQTPENPNTPDNPNTPEVPDKPDTPENPDNPNTPENPEDPNNPNLPDNPDQPENPDNPDTPVQPDIPPAEEKFELNAQTFEAVVQNITPLVGLMARGIIGKSYILDDIYDFYFEKSEDSQIVDTICATYSAHSSHADPSFFWSKLTLPVTEDLTLESLSKTALDYKYSETKSVTLYYFSVSREIEAEFSEASEIVKKQTFENYATAEWIGWRGENGITKNTNWVMCYENGVIREVLYYVNHNHFALGFTEAVKQNFYGKEPSDDTYEVYYDRIKKLPGNHINIRAMRQSFEEENQN